MTTTRTPSIKILESNGLVTISNTETALKAFGGKLKEQINEYVQKVEAIEIKDTSSLQIGTAITTDLSKIGKNIEKRAKELSEPFKEQIGYIKAAKEFLLKMIPPALETARGKIVAFQNELNRQQEEGKQKLAQQQREQEAAIAAETTRKAGIQKRIFDFEAEAMGAIALAETKDQLKTIAKQYSVMPLTEQEDIEFTNQIIPSLARISGAGNSKWHSIVAIAKLKGEQAELKKKEMELATEEARIKSLNAQQEAQSNLQEDAAIAKEEVAAEVTGQMMDLDVKVGPATRESYFFETVKEEDVPHFWKTVDEAKIRQWLKIEKEAGRELPKDGDVVWGVKFGIKQTPVLR